MKRVFINSSDDGWFYIGIGDSKPVGAGTLQNALIKAIQQAGIEGVELAPTLQESLLGTNE